MFVALASLRPMDSGTIEPWDKLGHIIIYGVFAIVGYRAVNGERSYYCLCGAIIVFGGVLEVAQSFMPGRVMSGLDFVANAIGVFLGAVVVTRALDVNNT